MQIRLLCAGDVVGSPGRRALIEGIAQTTESKRVDCCIANAENIASGSGVTDSLYQKLVRGGVGVITLGDHVYRRREIIPVLETSDRIVRPANLPIAAPGKEFTIYDTGAGHRVAVFCLLGRMFMKPTTDCPFKAAERVLSKIPSDVKTIVVDIHAEATSEKIAMGWFLDGRVSLVFGTHTHVPTADETILPNGTGYISDLGMTGPYDSVLGRDKHRVLQSMTTSVPCRLEVADGDPRMCGVIADIDCSTGRCTHIERITVKAKSTQ